MSRSTALTALNLAKLGECEFKLADDDICSNCGTEMTTYMECLKCENCGLQSAVDVAMKTSSNFSNQYQTGNPALKTANRNIHNIFRKASPSTGQKTNTIIAELRKCNAEAKNTIPDHVISRCAELYATKNWKHRCGKRRGLLAACLKYILMEHQLPKTEREIAEILKISITALSKGDNMLRDAMRESTELDINISDNQAVVHIELLLAKLSLDVKYAKVAADIIESVNNTRILMEDKSRQFSKCVGVIYLLIQQVPMKASIEEISKKVIVFATYKKYYELLVINRRFVNPVLVANGIPKITREKYAEVAKRINGGKKRGVAVSA